MLKTLYFKNGGALPVAVLSFALALCSCSGIIDVSVDNASREDHDEDIASTAAPSDTTKSTAKPDEVTVNVILSLLGWDDGLSPEPEYEHRPDLQVITLAERCYVNTPYALSVKDGGLTYPAVVTSADSDILVDGSSVTALEKGKHRITVTVEKDGRWLWREYDIEAYEKFPVYMYIRAKAGKSATFGNSEVVLQNFGEGPVGISFGVKANAKPLIGKTKSEWLFGMSDLTLEPGSAYTLTDYSALSSWVKKHFASSFSIDVYLSCTEEYDEVSFNADNIRENLEASSDRKVEFRYNGDRLW